MHRLFVFYRLKDGVDIDDYLTWSHEVDQPAVRSYGPCHSVKVHPVVREYEHGPDRYDVAEEATVDDYGEWLQILDSAEHKPVADAFAELVDTGSVRFIVADLA